MIKQKSIDRLVAATVAIRTGDNPSGTGVYSRLPSGAIGVLTAAHVPKMMAAQGSPLHIETPTGMRLDSPCFRLRSRSRAR